MDEVSGGKILATICHGPSIFKPQEKGWSQRSSIECHAAHAPAERGQSRFVVQTDRGQVIAEKILVATSEAIPGRLQQTCKDGSFRLVIYYRYGNVSESTCERADPQESNDL